MTEIRAQSATRERAKAKFVSASAQPPLGCFCQPRALDPVLTSKRASQWFSSAVVFSFLLCPEVHLKNTISSSSQVPALES